MNGKIEVKELAYDEDVICPFCKKTLLKYEWEEHQSCEHIIFIATDEGWEFMSPRYKELLDSYDADRDDNIDEFTSQLPIPCAIKFAQYSPPPGMLGAYWGFEQTE